MRQRDYYEAYLDDFDKIIVFLSRSSYDGVSNRFYLKDEDGNIFDLHIQSIETTGNNYNKYILSVSDTLAIGKEYYVVHQHARSAILQYSGIVKKKRFDDMFYYHGKDLGYTYYHEKTSFALWAPTASRVKLEITKNHITKTYDMTRSDKGVFRITILQDLENATYIYLVRVNGKWNQTIDPYGNASIENSKRSAIIDMKKIHVNDYDLPPMESACDAIIYEANVRDMTMQVDNGVNLHGMFRGFVEENAMTQEKVTGFTYLKSLGITHVQLMPVMDFGSVNELFPHMHYNWGYDPVQYRVLEGGYSTDPTNPYGRVFGFIKLVEECHKAGIRVNLDVVFNHVYDKETHAFENTVPNYYFQMNEEGAFSNGTYCGNDIDSTRKMCSKYILDACIYLVKTFHIDGFRFDLMGILDVDTMNAIEAACHAINPDFMIYGEGWEMPSFLNRNLRATITNQAKMPMIAHFSDRFRDVAKGRTASNEVSIKGYCTGDTYLLETMKNCMSASCTNTGFQAMFSHPRNVINYVECHDNMTSWDKIKACCSPETRETRIARQEMLIAAVLMAQGIPFLHAGQEFARTKHGLGNTYEERDEINQLDYHRKEKYQEIVSCTKELIKIRKEHACLRYSIKEDVEKYVSFADIKKVVLIYKVRDEKEELMVFFNPSGNTYEYDFNEEYRLLYDNGKIDRIAIRHAQIRAYRTMIVHRFLTQN